MKINANFKSKTGSSTELVGVTLVTATFVGLGLATGYFAFEAKRNFVEKRQMQVQVQLVQDYLERMEDAMASMQNYRNNIEDIAKSPLDDGLATEEEFETNVSRFIQSYREKSDLRNKDRSMTERLATLKESTSQMEQTLRSLTTVLGHSREFLTSIPSITPANGWLTSNYGTRHSPFSGETMMHQGIDIGAREGSPVFATADGKVEFSGNSKTFGNIVIIQHDFGIRTKYAHNSKLTVRTGQRVKRGQKIALVGTTGRSTGPHLHYEVWVNNQPVNPANYLIDRLQDMTVASNGDGVSSPIGGEEFDIEVRVDTKNKSSVEQKPAMTLAAMNAAKVTDASTEMSPMAKLRSWRKTTGFALVTLGCLLFAIVFGYAMVARSNRQVMLANQSIAPSPVS